MRWSSSLALLVALAGCTDLDRLLALEGSGARPPTWIFGGSSATAARHDAVVAIQALDRDGIYVDPFCTGTLIRGDWVLTAAHCIESPDPEALAIYVGDDPSRDLVEHAHPVAEVHVFPRYDARSIEGDIALLRLHRDVAALEGVTPVPELANLDGITDDDAGARVDLVGFGVTEDGTAGVKLHVFEELGGLVDDDVTGQIWTDQRDGTGTCSGDSGGPLMIERDGGWRVAGVTSYGDADCVDYGVYTHVDYYESWILDVIGGGASGVAAPADATPPAIELGSVYVEGDDFLLTFTTDEHAACRTCDDDGVCADTGWTTAHEAGWAAFTPPVTIVCTDRADNEATLRAEW